MSRTIRRTARGPTTKVVMRVPVGNDVLAPQEDFERNLASLFDAVRAKRIALVSLDARWIVLKAQP